MSYHSLNTTLDTITELANEIDDACSMNKGGASSVATTNANKICELVELIQPAEETGELYGQRVEGPKPHDNRVSGSGENVRKLCYKAITEDRDAEHKRVRQALQASQTARARTSKARRLSRRRSKVK